jgi:hypothetical protein
MIKKINIFIALILTIVMMIVYLPGPITMPQSQAASFGIIERVFTDKSRYNPGDTATITVQLSNFTGLNWSGDIDIKIFHIENQIHIDSQSVTLNNGNSTDINFNWITPYTDFKGYYVRIDAGIDGSGATAIDVSSDFTKFPRYGYISEMSSAESSTDSNAKINELAQDYHINAWQFYDWMWRHEKVIKRTNGIIDNTWIDLFNREIAWQTLQNQISAVHDQNGTAMAYSMVYHARENFSTYGVDEQWGLFEDANHTNHHNFNFGFGPILYFFDPLNLNWQNHIFNEYLDTINAAGFDGIHVDQMGQRNSLYDYNGNLLDLSQRFSPFLNEAKSVLTNNDASNDFMTFNIVDGTVDGWAVNDLSTHANVDFLYSEIWHLSDSYIELKDYIDSIRENSGNKAVVLAAYMNYKENIGPRYEAEDAVLTNVGTNTNHSGYTGTGFVDQFNDQGDEVTFTINAPEDGYYSLVFRHANATLNDATRNLYVNNNFEKELSFHWMDNWSTWSHEAYHQIYLTQGNHTVKLAYDNGNSGAMNLDGLTLGTFDEHSVRLADAMMAASGATHIELGEDSQMLAHEYYPNRSKSMRNSLKDGMKDHYNFITAYENLLFDKDVVDNDAGNQFVDITNVSTSGDAAGGSVWHILKRTPEYNVVHLINLLNNDNQWRTSGNQPTVQTQLATKVYIGVNESISNVYVASPDLDHGATEELSFTTGTDSVGSYISFTVPSLEYWNMIYMKRTFSTPTDDIYEAESAIKTNVSTNTNHSGYTGTGFVDGFADINDGVSFVVNSASDNDYVLRYRYSNGGSDASRDVYVDGKFAGTVQLASTGSWSTWGHGELTVRLNEGLHNVVLWYNSINSGAVNLDHLDLDKTYIWQFDRQIISVPAGYRITFRVGQPGWVHWGTNNWQNVVDTAFITNGSDDDGLDYEVSIGPFTSNIEVDFTFLWDDNNNGIPEYSIDRWEGTDFQISIN